MKLLIIAQKGKKQQNNLEYWQEFVAKFFSPSGTLRLSQFSASDNSSKQFEVSTPALARYYWTNFKSGVHSMQMALEKAREQDLPNGGSMVESPQASFFYWLDNGCQVSFKASPL